MLCSVALLTVTPPTNTGLRRATGVTAPVRPTWNSIPSTTVSSSWAGNFCAIAQRGARRGLGDAHREGVLRYGEQAPRLGRGLTDGHRDGSVGEHFVQLHAHVHAQQVAGLQQPSRRRNAVHDLVVQTRTQRGRKSVQALERRLGSRVVANVAFRQSVQRARAHAGLRVLLDQRQHARHDFAGPSDRVDLFGRLQPHHSPSRSRMCA